MKAGRFREDLFYRLNVIQLRMPPLRERRDDIPAFLDFFLRRFTAELGRGEAAFSPEALELLLAWPWPGNVRELANVVERAATLSDGSIIGPEALPPGAARRRAARRRRPRSPPRASTCRPTSTPWSARALEQALERTGGNKTEAAKLLALTFRSLRYRLAKYGIGGD